MNKAKQKTTDIEPMIKKTRARSETAQLAVRSLILNTARKLFQANDVDLISLRSIAREVDMAPGALYTYFPSKISLMRAVWAEDLARLNVELSAYPKESTLLDFSCFFVGRRQKLSATPDLSGTVLPLCLIPNSALKNAPPFKSVMLKVSVCVGLPA